VEGAKSLVRFLFTIACACLGRLVLTTRALVVLVRDHLSEEFAGRTLTINALFTTSTSTTLPAICSGIQLVPLLGVKYTDLAVARMARPHVLDVMF
jgi:hypothetical protein